MKIFIKANYWILHFGLLCLLPACRYTELHERTVNRPENAATQTFDGHVALVQDSGFDLGNLAFQTSVLDSYSINCWEDQVARQKLIDEEKSAKSLKFNEAAFEVFKEYSLKHENLSDQTCEFVPNLKTPDNSYYSLLRSKRDEWNQKVLAKEDISGIYESIFKKDLASRANFTTILSGAIGSGFHGTATAGLIALNNPKVRLVLVDDSRIRDQAPPEKKEGDGPLKPEPCTTQGSIDQLAKLYSDPEFLKAYINRPIPQFETDFAAAVRRHGVTLLNRSYGIQARQTMVKAALAKGCPALQMNSYFQAYGSALNKRKNFIEDNLYGKTPYIEVRAAGNDGEQVDSFGDQLDCRDSSRDSIGIGAVTATGELTRFSDHGNCVDGFAYGEKIILAGPDNFYTIADGTSFSSPMVVRSLSMNTSKSMSPSEIKSFFLSKISSGSKILPDSFQALEYVYEKKSGATSSKSLVSATTSLTAAAAPLISVPSAQTSVLLRLSNQRR